MADTDTETLPNGTGGLSAAEEEDERLKQRPADIDADVREMERRKRVEALMSSKLFREELERVLDQQMNEGADAPLLQRIKEMVGGRLHTGSMRGPSCVLPINDIRGIEGIGYEKGEKILRCKLAAVYRLVDLFGWTQTGQGSQISARLNTAVEQVLTTPRGLLPHELTASSLVKVDMQGVVQDQGTTNFPVNVAGFSVHASVHAARPDIRCVLHIRSPATLAISAMKNGLLPLSTEAALLGDIAYHTVPAGVLDNEERDKMVRVLGPGCKLLFITSNGALCCGETLEEAFYQAKNLTAACEVQLRLASLPLDSLILLDEDTRKQIYAASRKPPAEGAKWRVGGEEFEALMRMLDNAGFRTGYIYRHPLIKNDVPKPKSDVEVPPAVSSLGYLLEEEEMYKQGLWKKGQGKVGERTRWLNSPNVYQKVEVLETGTTDPKKITKWVDANNEEWVQDGSPAHSSTPVKIDTLQFVPMKTNPKEFKALQQQIKDNRRADKISAGPQSHILEGVTWDEANKINQAAEDASITHTGDHVVLMGAASKGIIQRGYQHNATVYSAPYARNPFDHVTDSEIDEYRRTVERRQRPHGEYDTDLSESEAISAAQITSPVSETEEESRDEHRVLRIETKQAPIRSQPEVVLSDVDTTDFLRAERVHAERTKGVARDPNLLSDDEVFLDSAASTASSALSPVTSPVVVVRHQRAAVQQNVIRGTNPATLPVRPKAPTPTLTPNPAITAKHHYPRNTNFDSIVKYYESPERSPLEEKKSHPKCKVSLNSRLLSSNDSVRADAFDYQPGHAGSRSSLYSIPSLEWDGRTKSEFHFKTRSLPRQGRKASKARLFRTSSHGGFINAFIQDPEPAHFHLPKCPSCGASNNSYAWELSKSSVGKPSARSPVNVPRERPEEFDAVKVMQKEVPVFKVAEAIKESEAEFVESQEFTEDCYLGEMQSGSSSGNLTVIEKTPDRAGLREPLGKLSTVDDEPEMVYDKVAMVKEFHENHGVEMAAVTDPEMPEEVTEVDAGWSSLLVDAGTDDIDMDKIESMETIHGDYLNFSDEMDFTQAVYDSPVKDLVEKDIRDYSVPINFYCEDYGKEDSKISPRKRREVAKATILEPILEESKSSCGDESSNATQGNDSGKESNRKSEECCDIEDDVLVKDINETTDSKVVLGNHVPNKQLQVLREEKIYPQDVDSKNELKSISSNILDDICNKAVDASLLKEELGKSADNTKLTSYKLETAYVYNKTPDYFVLEEGSDVTTFNLEALTHTAVETAIDLYVEEAVCNETEVMEDQESIIDSVYENIFEIFSNEAIRSDLKRSSTEDDAGRSSPDSKIACDQSAFEPRTLVFDSVTEMSDRIHAIENASMSASKNAEPQIFEPAPETLMLESCVDTNETDAAEMATKLDQQTTECRTEEISESLTDVTTLEVNPKVSITSSRGYSLGSTIPEMPSFNATLEFEKYEAVSEVIGLLLAKIDFSEHTDIDLVREVECLKGRRNIKLFDSQAEDVTQNATASSEKYEKNEEESCRHTEIEIPAEVISESNSKFVHIKKGSNEENGKESTGHSETENETFSITTIVEHIDSQITNLYDTEVTDSSQISETERVVEAIIYYIFGRTYSLIANKAKAMNGKKPKKVITVVDVEDILYTAQPLWALKDDTNIDYEADVAEIHPETKNYLQHEVSEPDLIKQKNPGLVVRYEDTGLYISDSEENIDAWNPEKVLNASNISSELKREVNVLAESHARKQNGNNYTEKQGDTPLEETETNESCLEIQEDFTENTKKFGENIVVSVDGDGHIKELGLDIAFHADNIEENVSDSEVDLEHHHFNIAVVHVYGDCTEHENIQSDKVYHNCENVEHDTELDAEIQPYQDILADSREIAGLNKRTVIKPTYPETDEIVPECVKSVVSSVLDEEVDDQDLKKMLEELRNADDTFVFLKPTEFRGEITLPFSFESMKPVFFNKDDIYDDQRQALIECAYSILEEILDKIADEGGADDENSFTDENVERRTHCLNETFVQSNAYDASYQEIDIYEEFEQNSTVIAQDIVNDLFENSFVANEMSFGDETRYDSEEASNAKKFMDETFVLHTHERNEEMNTAFVEDPTPYQHSRYSSPVRENAKIFDTCDESPIINASGGYLGEDLSVLVEKEDTISGSPFTKRNSVISMSQSFNAGGLKFWVSFDERLTPEQERPLRGPMERCSENSIPSFIAINFDRNDSRENISRTSWDETEVKRTGVLCESFTDSTSKVEANKSLYSMVTNESYHTACASKSDSFKTCEGFRTPVEESESKQTKEVPQKVLLYNTTKDNANTWPYRRQYSSWPPFEETLFYRLISKFRMSESFDPSDLENGDGSM